MTFQLCYNKNKVLCLTMTKDYKNFCKVADPTVKRVKLKNVESSKSCETDMAKRRWLIHILRRGYMLRTVFERRRRSTSETMLWVKLKAQKTEEKFRNYVIRNLCLEYLLPIICCVTKNEKNSNI